MTVPDRIDYDPADQLLDPDDDGQVDEIVLSAARVHLEMLTHGAAYFQITTTAGRWVHGTIYVRPTTRVQRARVLREHGDRLIDHLRGVLPGSGSIWSIPVHRRPGAAVRAWWDARRRVAAVLVVRVDEDEVTG